MGESDEREIDQERPTNPDREAEPVRPDIDATLPLRDISEEGDDPSAATMRSIANPAAGV